MLDISYFDFKPINLHLLNMFSGNWTATEDGLLREAVQLYGTKDCKDHKIYMIHITSFIKVLNNFRNIQGYKSP